METKLVLYQISLLSRKKGMNLEKETNKWLDRLDWLYQKINGSIVNRKPARFTAEEINTLNFALQDIGKK